MELIIKKVIVASLMVICSVSLSAQQGNINSRVYKFSEIKKGKFSDSCRDMEYFDLSVDRIKPGAKVENKSIADIETLVIVKEGKLTLGIGDKSASLGPGSVAIIMPGDSYTASNDGDGKVTYYVLSYRSREPMDAERGGDSFMIDWDDLAFNAHDRGGVRSYFDRPTVMGKRLEMHVTTLNPELKSHEPHTHRAAELILMISGNTQMQIADDFYQGKTGDVYFLGSEISHAIENVGKEPAMYFAFQWE